MTYAEKLRDPRWQKLRLLILERDNWQCTDCLDKTSTLHVHHLDYEKDVEPWDYPEYYLITLCETCHKEYESGKREREWAIIKSLRLKLKDSFIRGCADHVLIHFKDVHRLMYLLWELEDDKSMEILERAYKEKCEAVANNVLIRRENPDHCPACGGSVDFFEQYNYHKCSVCGYINEYYGQIQNNQAGTLE